MTQPSPDLDAIRARHAEAERLRGLANTIFGDPLPHIRAQAAHADRGTLLAALDDPRYKYADERIPRTAIEHRNKVQGELLDKIEEQRAALARLAGIVAEDIAVVLWGMDTQDCDRMGAAVLTFLRARLEGRDA